MESLLLQACEFEPILGAPVIAIQSRAQTSVELDMIVFPAQVIDQRNFGRIDLNPSANEARLAEGTVGSVCAYRKTACRCGKRSNLSLRTQQFRSRRHECGIK